MIQTPKIAVLAGLFAGLCWGIFWLPLRMIEEAGLDPPWAMAVFTAIPALMCLPVMWRLRHDYRQSRALWGGLLGGVAYALYAASLLYTDVVRAVLLFYLMPIWGFLLGSLVLRDKMTWYRWLAIALGAFGMFVVFADGTGLPLPRVAGDWFGLISGIVWAVACTMILTETRIHVATQTSNFFFSAAIVSVTVACVATAQGIAEVPGRSEMGSMLVWFVPVCLLLILPGGFASIYAPSQLNPGLVGLLFMTEIVVAVVTAALWANEVFGTREALGVMFIMLAGLIEPILILGRKRPVI